MSLSQIGRTISDSATLKLNATAASLRAQGEPVIHLGGGEPKSKAPREAIEAAAKLLATGEIRYAPAAGIPALKQAIIRYTERFYDRAVTPQNVIASGGAKQAIMVALQATIDPGDEVLYPAPYWLSYPEMAKLCGGVGVPVYAADGSLQPSLRDVEAKLTARTRAVILNSPNNPSGVMYSDDFIASVVELCEKRSLYLIMDDIYQRLVFDGRKPANCWRYARDRSETSKLIIVNGVSKQYAMTGFRIGWAVGNQQLIQAMTCIQSHQTAGSSVLGQVAAVAALDGDQSSVDELRTTLESNRDVLISRLKALHKVKVPKPDGTFYCFADFRAYNENSAELAEFLLNKVRVVTVPGIEFGLDGYLRISYCGTAKDVTEGIDRIKWALDPDGPRELAVGSRALVRDW